MLVVLIFAALMLVRGRLTPGSTAGCRRFEGHFIPPGPFHPDVRQQAANVDVARAREQHAVAVGHP